MSARVRRPNAPFRLDRFTGTGYDKGASPGRQLAWWVTQNLIFGAWWLPARLRPPILRAFGASIGPQVHIRNGVRIHWPWKLHVEGPAWIGEGAHLLNLEEVTVGANTCISQGAFIGAGSHDRFSESFEFKNAPIRIGPHCWITARAIVLAGSDIPPRTTVAAGQTWSDSAPTPE